MKGLCGTCKHTVYCTYRPDGGARNCEEFDFVESAPEHDWDLKALAEQFPAEGSGRDADSP